jgi:Uma2 family endonuclease
MSTIVLDTQLVHIPPSVGDLDSFRRWARSEEFPETGRICYLSGEVWVDMSKEQFSHNQVKGEIASVLTRLCKHAPAGRYFPDGYLLSNTVAELSTNPDGMFASVESLQTGVVRLIAGAEGGFVELEGAPDMVLEVVSQSSVQKDTVVLRDLYWRPGVREYWLVDVRGEKLRFEILGRGGRGYVTSRKSSGWIKSAVFGHSFRLTEKPDRLGYLEYTLTVR